MLPSAGVFQAKTPQRCGIWRGLGFLPATHNKNGRSRCNRLQFLTTLICYTLARFGGSQHEVKYKCLPSTYREIRNSRSLSVVRNFLQATYYALRTI